MVLFIFVDNLFNLSQFCNLSSSLLACSYNNLVSLWVLRIAVSSANNIKLDILEMLQISLI